MLVHGEDVVHGDLTGVGLISKHNTCQLNPTNRWQTNVLVDGSGNLRLADFGLSVIAAESGNLTFGSLQTGSTRWMAPESLDYHDEPEAPLKPTKEGDIYSFGCVMLQVCWIAIILDSLVSHHGLRSFLEKSPIIRLQLRCTLLARF
jgi:serine/threonine protein kinase